MTHNTHQDSFNKASTLLALTVILSSGTGPTGTPPDNNVATPLNVSDNPQYKASGLGLEGLFHVYGNTSTSTFDGKVGIGTSNPIQKLDVEGDTAFRGMLFVGDGVSSDIRKITAGKSLNFRNSDGNIEAVIDGAGKVGIGVVTPAEKLDVVGNAKVSGSLILPTGAAAGKVLTATDAAGNTSWKTPSSAPSGGVIPAGGMYLVGACSTAACPNSFVCASGYTKTYISPVGFGGSGTAQSVITVHPLIACQKN